MNPLLLVFFISSVAAHVSLRYHPTGPIATIAEEVMHRFQWAYVNQNKTAFISLFDKSFTLTECNVTITYSELEKEGMRADMIMGDEWVEPVNITYATIIDDELRFTIAGKYRFRGQKLQVAAKKFGGHMYNDIKFIKWEYEKVPCPPNGPRKLRQSSSSLTAADEAHQAAQSIVDVFVKARDTKNAALFLSLIDKSFTLTACGITVTYSEVVKAGISSDPVHAGVKIDIINAKINGDELTFTLLNKTSKGDEKMHIVAKNRGEGFKVIKAVMEGIPCSSNGSKKSSSSSSEEDTF